VFGISSKYIFFSFIVVLESNTEGFIYVFFIDFNVINFEINVIDEYNNFCI
jgi:hypothetical protein